MAFRLVDTDKVVKQLENLKEEYYQLGIKENEPNYFYASACYQRAIDVVKEVMKCV